MAFTGGLVGQNGTVTLQVEQMPLFSGEFGIHNGRNAIKVTAVHATRATPAFDPGLLPGPSNLQN